MPASNEWRLLPQWAHLPLPDAMKSALLQRTSRYTKAVADGGPPTLDDIVDDIEAIFEPLPPRS